MKSQSTTGRHKTARDEIKQNSIKSEIKMINMSGASELRMK
jgi:hypothetical protein